MSKNHIRVKLITQDFLFSRSVAQRDMVSLPVQIARAVSVSFTAYTVKVRISTQPMVRIAGPCTL